MLINLRNALMSGKRLPYDAEVEYLESTGTQWINTGLNYFADFEIGIKLRESVANKSLGVSSTMCMERRSAINPCWQLYVKSTGYVSTALIVDYHVMSWKGGVFAADGVTVSTVSNPFASGTMTLCGAGGSYYPNMIYACKLWDANGVLVRDFIPVRVGTVGYLYDRVSGKLFGNAGTGDFVIGQDVVPVEYIESHRTEYIDTGIVPTAADSFYCHIKQNVTKDQALWGLAGVAYCFSNWNGGGGNNGGTYWGHPAIGTGGVNGVNPLGDTNWHETLCQPSGIFVDGVQINTQVSGSAQSPQNSIALFARAVNSAGGGVAKNAQGRMSAFKVERNGNPLRKYLSVRVGTDATSWEGAMMDVLTRRIYRNAGTGAFTYGNDLKYPIPAE